MAKPKQPLLSLGAHGTIADSLTFNRRQSYHIARSKPLMPYILTLPVQYQRWLYEDYAHLWNDQSAATQKAYRAAGVRHHLTGFQYWMKYNLTNLPDIAGMWYLDDDGATLHDYSRNNNNGVILGASLAPGLIHRSLYFDGVNDTVTVVDSPSLDISQYITIEHFVRVPACNPAWTPRSVGKNTPGNVQPFLMYAFFFNNYKWGFGIGSGGLLQWSGWQATDTAWHHLAGTYDGANIRLWYDGVNTLTVPFIGPIMTNDQPVAFAVSPATWHYLNAYIDHCIIYNRALSGPEILRHSLRRWPE